ncbi:MAG: hypothetical protein LAP87_23950 [Acidobacteriia bacterium]|nr:hypothetical protein [Terriglobia bacterium]
MNIFSDGRSASDEGRGDTSVSPATCAPARLASFEIAATAPARMPAALAAAARWRSSDSMLASASRPRRDP